MKLLKNVSIQSGAKKKSVKKTEKVEKKEVAKVEEVLPVEPVEVTTEEVKSEVVLETPKEEEAVIETVEKPIKYLKEQVDDFIAEFFKEDASGKMIDTFANEKSYWFAQILFHRFSHFGAFVVYDRATDLFYLWACGKYYNSYGECEEVPESPVSWNTWVTDPANRAELIKRHLELNLV